MMKTILRKVSLMEVLSFKVIAFIGEKEKQNRISDRFSPPSCQYRMLPLFPETQTLVREHTSCVADHLELTRFRAFPRPKDILPFLRKWLSVLSRRIRTRPPRAAVPGLSQWLRHQRWFSHLSRVRDSKGSGEMARNVGPSAVFPLMKSGFQWAASIQVRDAWEGGMATVYSSVLL